jgi:hypothetical protein
LAVFGKASAIFLALDEFVAAQLKREEGGGRRKEFWN